MSELLEKLPEEKRKEGKLFLNELFLCIKDVDNKPEIEFFLGLIDKSFLKFGDKEPGSVSLTEFSRHLLGLTLLYIKSSNDLAIWNADFVPTLDRILRFLNINQHGTSRIKLLNQLEMTTFASLDHRVDINFNQLRSILKKHGTLETAQSFINSCNKVDNIDASFGFHLLVQDAKETLAENKNKDLGSSLLNFSLLNNGTKSHRLNIFKSFTDSYVSSSNEVTSPHPQ
ncbi:DNA repair protein [Legionella gratiana]|uniref:DNA repair protein n=2 Tax=Legionella gratiana TaxID=45066 RepID=A0A378JKA3_9GAMM|nr:DNA repair protein [Legionella gratiana]STX45130.1 DNA repair protein [Legionella gratiana]